MSSGGFGNDLKGWRDRTGVSQLDLGLRAGVSARHISFLETGRARPSRSMVLRLAGALDLRLREQNDLLLAAGFAPRYGERSLDDAEAREARRALRFILDAHEPYPAFVLDHTWRIVLWNRPQAAMLAELDGPNGSPADLNALDLVFAPGPMRESFVNWEEVARAVLRRLRRQMSRVGPGDPLHEVWDRVQGMPGVAELDTVSDAHRPMPVLVPMRMREGDRVLTWYSTLAVFGATGDVTLEELVIESFFPGDEVTRAFVEQLAGALGNG
ncbi:MAG: helix-turn-helix transcriptional regulator [Acidobacteriota bacterium]|nr:helix-turn-helix transcriptional regulator [Acidobacteriota bacterium]